MKTAKKPPRSHTRSIIWRIHGGQLFQIFLLFLFCDLFLFWILFSVEFPALSGALLSADLPETLPANFPLTEAVTVLTRMRPLLTAQLVYWIYFLLFGSARLHRIMQPLTRLTETTQALSREKLDDEVFHQLESAVSRIDPLAAGQTVHTGNSELLGLEAAVNSLLDRMRQTYRRQTQFVSDASHELRTPIAVIQGYVGMLDRWGKSDPKVLDESIAAIKSEAEHMQHLVEQLLFLARSDSGRNPLTLRDFSLSDMLSETLREYEMIDSGHQWRLRLTETPVHIHGDDAMLKQALRILCDNACKYSPAGTSITLSLRRDADRISFSVQDEGIGIPAEAQAHVFERFYRADPSRVRQTGGTGLGLSIAQWIVERHGGRIELLSREDMGTRMTVHLPVQARL
ncbi:MAG: sensor histidine kinase [Butyricicoccaceae bacterium]